MKTPASERERQLREMLRTPGFKPDYLPTCKMLNSGPLSENLVRMAVGCESAYGAAKRGR